MLDLGFVRNNLELVERKLAERKASSQIDRFREVDQNRRQLLTEVEGLKNKRNKASEEIARLKREKQSAESQIGEMKIVSDRIKVLDDELRVFDVELTDILMGLPNIPHATVPVGSSSDDNQEVRRWGDPRQFSFKPRAHWEIGESLGILDLARAAKITGARFAVYWDLGARLERALANFMLDVHTSENGYTEILPPFMVNADSMYGTGQLPKFEEDLFKIPGNTFQQDPYHLPKNGEEVFASGQNGEFRIANVNASARKADIRLLDNRGKEMDFVLRDIPFSALSFRRDFYLIPTAEVPVTNLFRDETLNAELLPISMAAYTPCFRSEAGSYGKDTRGIIRQHQFQKVELVKISHPESSYDALEKLTSDAESILQKLKLPYRVMALCTADLGFGSAKTYDLEVWLPGQDGYREISSCSNCESFQARRANIRFRAGGRGKSEFVHTLNGSGLAIGRTWTAVVENYQQEDGSVLVPQVLKDYLGGAERITADGLLSKM